jgi:threonine dehydrogenase-like Zn-dependent dehydrogenase
LAQALSLLSRRSIDISALITHTFPLGEIHAAFETAEKRLGGALKVVVRPQQ